MSSDQEDFEEAEGEAEAVSAGNVDTAITGDGATAVRQSSRNSKPTPKGLAYAKDQAEVKLVTISRTLNKLSKRMFGLLELGNAPDIQTSYVEWLNNYEKFLKGLEALVPLCKSPEETQSFKIDNSHFMKVKAAVQYWFAQNEIGPKDSASRLSKASSRASKISDLRIELEQQRVELTTKVSALEERKQIEQEKLQLKLREEELELKTKLFTTQAKGRVLDQLEESGAVDRVSVHTVEQPEYKAPVSTQSKKFSPSSRHAVSAFSFGDPSLLISKELRKPVIEVQKFRGSPIEFPSFQRQFKTQILALTESPDERMNYLLQFTEGEAHKVVLGYAHLDAEFGFLTAMKELKVRYGDPEIVANAYITRALNWSKIDVASPRMSFELDRYSVFLTECLHAVESIGMLQVLEFPNNMQKIVRNLPNNLHDKWRSVVFNHKDKGKPVTFRDLVEFVRKEARKAIDPVYGKDVLLGDCKPKSKQIKQPESKYSFSTSAKAGCSNVNATGTSTWSSSW